MGDDQPGVQDAFEVLEPDAEPPEAELLADEDGITAPPGGEESVVGVPVLAEVRAIERTAPSLPAVQAAAAAATGFVAGAAALALVRRRAARRARRTVLRSRRSSELLPVLATRTFLVDVHLIGRPED